ncbi:MAG: DUF192 domain-containing protein [Bdellovibrionaceae bacterium]|nr:DUF192 domain-containing protein [Pseudobdellovibrionaceae bacterium]
MKLHSETRSIVLVERLHLAGTILSRMIGLIGRNEITSDEALWINPCNSIHTFFMKFPIDCVFLDKNMKVCAVRSGVKPWRILWPVFAAKSVVEMRSGRALELGIQIGEKVYVGV